MPPNHEETPAGDDPTETATDPGESAARDSEEREHGKQTPLSWDAIDQARATITDDLLGESDPPLVELLDRVQQYVDNHEYVDRPGNAFVERLVEEINDRNSLRRLAGVGDQEVFVIIGAEGWAQITDELGFNDRQSVAVRDAHHTYAEMRRLEPYVTQVNLMCIRMYDERLREFLDEIEPEHTELSAGRLDELVDQLTVDSR